MNDSAARADRRHAPQSLLEGCVHHHADTLPVVQHTAVGQVLTETKDHYDKLITRIAMIKPIQGTVLNAILT